MISLSHVSLSLNGLPVLDDVNLTIEPGECVCISDPNGESATALLSLLLAMERPDTGKVTVDGVDLAALPARIIRHYRRGLGIMSVEDDENSFIPSLFPERNIAENIAFPLRAVRLPCREIEKRVAELLLHIGLLHLAASFPKELNPLERRKILLARALAQDPAILLLVEPLTALPAEGRIEMLSLLKEEHRKGKTLFIFTKEESIARTFGGRMLRFAQGKLLETRASAPLSPPRAPAHITPLPV